ncbi:MAG TPA: dihydrolipoamide acetyltransferase family protein [Ktedonobacterales bacterium]|nr:dihydrolipoamide acetyltransferase family protein [Ktedonobacterales bacterium]
MHTVVMPKLGDTMEEGKILNWLVKEGDTVAKGDALAEIETEKVTIPVEAFNAGVVRKILVPNGTTVPVGEPIALTGTADEPLPAEAGGQARAEAAQEAAPGAGNPTELTHEQAQAGAAPETVLPPTGQPLTSTATQAAPQPAMAGAPPAPTGAANGRAPQAQAPATQPAAVPGGERVFISPIARRIAVEHGLDINTIQGTGPSGRVIREDVEAALAQQEAARAAQVAQPQPVVPTATAAAAVPAAQPGEEVRAVPLSMMRKTIAKRLQQSAQTAPHFYVTMAIDATELGELREQINSYAATLPQPLKISLNDLIIKGVALALAAMPEVNVSFNGDELLYKSHINVGMAVALEQGLIVPVIRDADKRGVLDIVRESRRLAEAARSGKLKPEEFQGGTFSISNLGMYGVDEFTAIINPPEAAILAIGAATPTPVVREGQVAVRDIMKVTLSVDHRALDGATAARWLQELKKLLEQPMALLV